MVVKELVSSAILVSSVNSVPSMNLSESTRQWDDKTSSLIRVPDDRSFSTVDISENISNNIIQRESDVIYNFAKSFFENTAEIEDDLKAVLVENSWDLIDSVD